MHNRRTSIPEKIYGNYPDGDTTPKKILKKLGFDSGKTSSGVIYEHGAIADKHGVPEAKEVSHKQGTKGFNKAKGKKITAEKSISLKSGLKDAMVNSYMKGKQL